MSRCQRSNRNRMSDNDVLTFNSEGLSDLVSSAGNSFGAFPGQNKRAYMLSDGNWSVNGVCVTWRDRASRPLQITANVWVT